MESIDRGVLDTSHARGMTAGVEACFAQKLANRGLHVSESGLCRYQTGVNIAFAGDEAWGSR
jgi:hypothetical protein